MSIVFSCNSCAQSYQVAETAAGKQKKCMKCGAPMLVPQREPVGSPAAAGKASDSWLDEADSLEGRSPQQAPSGKPASQATSVSPRLLALIGGGTLASLVLIVGLLYIFSGGENENDPRLASTPAPLDSPARTHNQSNSRGSYDSQRTSSRTSDTRVKPSSASPSQRSYDSEKSTSVVSTGGGTVTSQGGQNSQRGRPETANADDVKPTRNAWTVEADPLPTPLEPVAVKPDFTLPVHSLVHLATSDWPSRYVALVSNVSDKEGFLRIDLNTGDTQPVPGDPQMRKQFTLRADGHYLAGLPNLNRSATVVSLRNGVWHTVTPVDDSMPIVDLQWTGDLELLTVQHNHKGTILTKWNMESGESTSLTIERDAKERFVKNSVTISPGGRYATLITGTRLSIYEFATGERLGYQFLPELGGTSFIECEGICFSPDGSKLAACLTGGREVLLACWDFVTQEKLLYKRVPWSKWEESEKVFDGVHGYEGKPLTWLPGVELGWLLKGMVVLDGQSGSPVWNLSKSSYQTRMPISPTEIVMFGNYKGGKKHLIKHEIPGEELAQRINVLRSGGRVADIGLPPLTDTDLSNVRQIELPEEGEVAWNYEIELSNSSPAPLAQPAKLDIDVLPEEAVLARDADRLIMLKAGDLPREAQHMGAGMEIVSFQTDGSQKQELLLPTAAELVAVSPNGEQVLLGEPANGTLKSSRVDVWSTTSGEPVAAWRPYTENGRVFDRVTSAVFIDSEHVITNTFNRRAVLWKLPECKPVYSLNDLWLKAISPGGRYAVWLDSRRRRLLITDALTGQPQGACPIPGATPTSLAFSPDGMSLAGVSRHSLAIWNLETGELSQQMPLAAVTFPAPLQWLDDRYLLAGNRHLIDMQFQAPIWEYTINYNNTRRVSGSHDDTYRFITRDPQGQRPGKYLAAVKLPTQLVKTKVTNVNPEDLYILGPGGSVSLNLSVGVPGVDVNELREELTERLGRNNITVTDSAPVQFTLRGSQRSTNKTQTYNELGLEGRNQKTVREQLLTMSLTISDKQGRKWENTREQRGSGGMVEHGNIEEKISKQLQQAFKSFALNYPKYVYPTEGNQVGQSLMTLRGEMPVEDE